MDTWKKIYPYIKYEIPGNVTFFLTPRPDAYDPQAVADFVANTNPKVRFQFTDDITEYTEGPTMHWYSWIPGKRLPTELVWTAVSLIRKYASTPGTIWMHCDSSSMRAPTFFGHFLRIAYSREFMEKLESTAFWTDGRQQSKPTYYSDTSLEMDPGMKELIEAWQESEGKAHTQINKIKEWDQE